jgi:hypothetical protein
MSLKSLETTFIKSFDRTKSLLFPFSFKKWFILAFIAIMAGAIGGSSFSVDFPVDAFRNQEPSQGSEQVVSQDGSPVASDSDGNMVTAIIIGAVFLFIALPLVLLFLWLNSRFIFIFYNSTVFNTTAIKIPWAQYKMQGNSLFKARILIWVLVAIVGIVLVGSGIALTAGGDYTALFVLIPLLFVYIIAIAIINHYIDQFLVPIMAIDGVNFMQALGVFRQLFSSNKGLFILFVLVAMGLGLACGTILMLLFLAVLLLFIIAGLVIFGGAYAIFGTDIVFILICVILGIPFAIALMLTMWLVSVPFAYFYRNFTLYYLMNSSCNYDFFGDRAVLSGGGQVSQGSPQQEGAPVPPPLPPQS